MNTALSCCDEHLKKVVGVLLTIATIGEVSTGLNIFKVLDDVLKEQKIPWKNCLRFSADNASVMMGIYSYRCCCPCEEREPRRVWIGVPLPSFTPSC